MLTRKSRFVCNCITCAIRELAQRNPANLYQRMAEVNQQKQLVRRLPSEAEVEDWIAQAKKLPRAIKY